MPVLLAQGKGERLRGVAPSFEKSKENWQNKLSKSEAIFRNKEMRKEMRKTFLGRRPQEADLQPTVSR